MSRKLSTMYECEFSDPVFMLKIIIPDTSAVRTTSFSADQQHGGIRDLGMFFLLLLLSQIEIHRGFIV